MQTPRKRNSKILEILEKEKDPLESNRTRTSMLIAARIIETLKQQKMSKIEFASRMQKKPSVITRWLSGTHNFTSDTLSDIQFVLGVQLLNLEPEATKFSDKFSAEGSITNKYRIEKDVVREEVADLSMFELGKVVSISNYKKPKGFIKAS